MIDIFLNFPQGGLAKVLSSEYATDPKDALYTMRTQMFTGLLDGTYPHSKFSTLLYRGRPLLMTYQSDEDLLFGRDAIELAEKDQAKLSGDVYKTHEMDSEMLSCFSSLLSQYPVFRNFSPRMLIVDELFLRMVDDGFSGCLFVSTWSDSVLLFIMQGLLLNCQQGKVIDRYPINEAPVTSDMAKAMSLMGDPTCNLDIYETPENLFVSLASLEFGISFPKSRSLNTLKESLIQMARDELKAKSVDFDNAMSDTGNNIQQVEDVCFNLEKYLTINFPRRTLKTLSERCAAEISKFKLQR